MVPEKIYVVRVRANSKQDFMFVQTVVNMGPNPSVDLTLRQHEAAFFSFDMALEVAEGVWRGYAGGFPDVEVYDPRTNRSFDRKGLEFSNDVSKQFRVRLVTKAGSHFFLTEDEHESLTTTSLERQARLYDEATARSVAQAAFNVYDRKLKVRVVRVERVGNDEVVAMYGEVDLFEQTAKKLAREIALPSDAVAELIELVLQAAIEAPSALPVSSRCTVHASTVRAIRKVVADASGVDLATYAKAVRTQIAERK